MKMQKCRFQKEEYKNAEIKTCKPGRMRANYNQRSQQLRDQLLTMPFFALQPTTVSGTKGEFFKWLSAAQAQILDNLPATYNQKLLWTKLAFNDGLYVAFGCALLLHFPAVRNGQCQESAEVL